MVMLALFSILSLALYKICSSRISLARKADELILAKQAAYSMCEVILRDLQEDGSTYHNLYELRLPQEKEFGLATVSYYFIDEESKINVNNVSEDVLKQLEGLDEKEAEKIYESILRPYSAKEEMLLVEDIDTEEYNEIKGFITIYGSGVVNINTAPKEVLLALGMSESLASDIINFRAGFDNEEITEDDNYFETQSEIIDKLNEYYGLFKEDEEKLQQLIAAGLIDAKSSNFNMKLAVKVKERPAKKYDIILNKNGVVNWREY
jgi:DNA uptake protein ComE-like DNA-binding protein